MRNKIADFKYLLLALLLLSPFALRLSPLYAAKANKQVVVLSCDLHCQVNNGLSEESQAQLAEKTGEEIVDADIAAQLGK